MPFFLSAIGNEQQFNANGSPLSGGKINTYAAGTTTRVATYTDKAGATEQANPIILNTLGLPANPIWLKGGVSYKFVITDSTDVVQRTVDDITGTNDPAVASSVDQWVLFTAVPTFISATSFSLAGDQTNTFQVGRRVKSANTGGTGYHTITASAFASGITTVTVTNDSLVLDTGLSAVSYGLLSAIDRSATAATISNTPAGGVTETTVQGAINGLETRTYKKNNILGTVSQSAGVPTGAIIERGSNANGEYVRLADGTQICTMSLNDQALAANFTGSLGSLTFPAAFIVAPHMSGSAGPNLNFDWYGVTGFTALTATSVNIVARNGATAQTAIFIRVTAIGRWF